MPRSNPATVAFTRRQRDSCALVVKRMLRDIASGDTRRRHGLGGAVSQLKRFGGTAWRLARKLERMQLGLGPE
jgi:hypothetical protein